MSSAGEVTQLIQFDNIVPTGLAVSHHKVFMSEAGPVPYLPATGKVVSFRRVMKSAAFFAVPIILSSVM